MKQLVEHVAGDEESSAGVVAKYLDEQGPKSCGKKVESIKGKPEVYTCTGCHNIMHFV